MKMANLKKGFKNLMFAVFTATGVMCAHNANALQLPTINQKIYTDPVTMVPVNVGANTFVDITPKTGAFVDVSVVCKIEFGYDVNYPKMVTPTGLATTVDVLITPYNQFNVAGTPFTHTFSIKYDPTNPNPVKDKDLYVLTNAWRVDAQITAINGLGTGTLPANMYIDLKLDIDRVYDFNSVLTTGPSLATPTLIDIDGITGNDEIKVTWTALQGSDEYQLEWTYINDYGPTLAAPAISPSLLPFDFRNNSTRITTKNLEYRIPLLFDRGWVAFRLRAVGRDMTNPTQILFTDWNNNIPDASPTGPYPSLASISTKVQIVTPHESNKNWMLSTTYAEEGKKKELIGYYDGTLRNRQSITKINSSDDVVVGETIYDYQGRAAVSVLPSPVDNNTPGFSPSLHYYPFFNQSDTWAGEPYTKEDFDLDAANSCDGGANPMSTISGASKYYSPNNPDMSNERSFIPDGKKYPFAQIEYTPDITGRIRSIGGSGTEFQLGGPNTHEVKVFYGQPNQLQLDRLFGSEAGDAAHYKKDVSIDPNGQSHVVYIDQEGRTIAHAMAGDAPAGMEAIPSEATAAVNMNIDLFAKDPNGNSNLNTINQNGDAVEFSTQLLVPYAANYSFNYDFSVGQYTDTCLADSICFSCVYNLTLSIKDECGAELVQYSGNSGGPINNFMIGQFSLDSNNEPVFNVACTGNYTMAPTYSQTIPLAAGNYTITKTLTVNQDAIDFYIDQYLDPEINTCFKTLEDFQQSYLDSLDTTSCYIDCDECLANLGSKDDFVGNGLGTALEYDVLYEQCVKDCKVMYSPCEAAFEMMLSDMTPGGQYAEYLSSSTINPGAFPLSVLNTMNQLPKNTTAFGGVTLLGTWKKPKTVLNNTTYNDYINDDGSIASVAVFQTSPGVYSPAIDPLVIPFIVGSIEYVRPQQLANVADFISEFSTHPEWAKGLVYLHPEYCYYEKCRELGIKQGTDTYTSDEYYSYLNQATTFAGAQTGSGSIPGNGKFINPSGVPYNPSIPSTTNIYDPYLDPANSAIFGPASAMFMAKWNQYMPKTGGGWYNMYEFAAVTVRCGALYGLIPGGSCDDFGQPITGYTAAQNTAVYNQEWGTYKGFYQALRSQVQQDIADQYALKGCYGLNDCIGNGDEFNPWVSGMLTYTPIFTSWFTSPYFDQQQPCSSPKRYLYANKQTRFPDAQSIPSILTSSPQEAAYQAYLATGQCPKATALEGVINEFAQQDLLEALNENLLNHNVYGIFYLVDNNYAPSTPITTNTPSWKMVSSVGDNLQVIWQDPSLNVKLKLELDKTGSGIANWNDLEGLTNLQAGSTWAGKTYPFAFTMTAHYKSDTLDTCIVINGSTTYDVDNCVFPEVCNANQFATDLQVMMSSLASTTQLTTTSTITPTFNPMISAGIRTQLGVGPTTPLEWSYNSGVTTWTLKQPSTTFPRLEFKITAVDPISWSLAGLNTIKYFTDIKSAYQNYFTFDAFDATNTKLVNLKCQVTLVTSATTSTAVSMGECGLPDPLLCQDDAYQITEDLSAIFQEALAYSPPPSTPYTSNLMPLSSMTTLVSGYLGNPPASTTTYIPDPVGPNYQDTLIFEFDTLNELDTINCELILSFNSTSSSANFNNVFQVGNVVAYGPVGFDNWQHNFYIPVVLTTGEADTIYGYSDCLPVANCTPCPESISEDADTTSNDSLSLKMGKAMFEPSIAAYDDYVAKVDHINSVNGWVAGDANYLTKLDYEAYFKTGVAYQQETFSRYIDNYTIAYDEKTWITDPLTYVAEYGIGINVSMEYERYIKATDAYNARAASAGVASLTPVSEDVFANGRYADKVFDYVKYLDAHPVAGETTLGIVDYFAPGGGGAPPSDACGILYAQYVEAWKDFVDYQTVNNTCFNWATLYPLYSYETFVANNLCCGPYGFEVFNEYIHSFEDFTTCPEDLPNLVFCEPESAEDDVLECEKSYSIYIKVMTAYNTSAYAVSTGYFLPVIYNSFFEFYAAGKCDCIDAYVKYLSDYIAGGDPATMPPPVNIDQFGPCFEPLDELPTDECADAYENYIDAVMAYNAWAKPTGFPIIKVILKPDMFTAEQLCYCVEGYIAYLESIQSGVYDLAYVMSHISQLDLAKYCEGKLTPPCTPESNPFSQCIANHELPEIPYSNPCVEQMIQNALQNGLDDYNQYVLEVTTNISNAYKQHCLGAIENFTALYKDKEYQFTLYYYDQAGNIVKTIPPAGVLPLDFDSDLDGIQEYNDPRALQVAQDRLNGTQTIFTFHTLATTYEYNSLNQMVKQNVPDHDQMSIWETTLPNGLDPGMTITKIQYIDGNKGFLTGHVTASLGDRGLLYTTNDAGATWQRVNDVVGATINKVHFFDNLNGYAACDNGIILKTSNGGGSWDMLLTYDQNIDWRLNDLYFTSATDGVVVGDKEFSLRITGGTVTTLSSAGAFTNSSYSSGGYFRLTSVTHDGTNYIAAAKHKVSGTSPEQGRIYFSNNGLTWTEYTQFSAPDLNNVSFTSSATPTTFMASGQAGNSEKLTTGTNLTGSDLATNITGHIIDAHYMNANEGIAIIENTPSQGGIYKTADGGKTWSLLSTPGDFYNRLDAYETGTATHKVTATGFNNTVDRVIMNTGSSYGIIPLTNPAGSVNYYASWAATLGANLVMIAAGDAGNFRYTTTAALSATIWTTVSPGISTGENIRKIVGTNFGTLVAAYTFSGLTLTASGNIYGLFKNTGGVWSSSPISIAGANFTDICYAPGNTYALAFDNNTKQLYRIDINNTGPSSTATLISGAFGSTNSIRSIAQNGSDVLIVGAFGTQAHGTLDLSSLPTNVTWLDGTVNQVPLGFTSVEFKTGLTYASTGNGNIYRLSGANWQQLQVRSIADFNALAFDVSGTSGLVVGDNGSAFVTAVSGSSVTLTSIPLATTQHLNDVNITNTTAGIVGNNGLVFASSTFATATSYSQVGAIGNQNLRGIARRPSSPEAICVGQFAHIRKVNGSSGIKINQVFTPSLNAVNFVDNMSGYVTGNDLTVRHTIDGGMTWNVVLPSTLSFTSLTLPDMFGVKTLNLNGAVIAATQGRVYKTSVNTLNLNYTGSTTENFHDVDFENATDGYVVGGSVAGASVLHTTNAGTSFTLLSTYSTVPSVLKAVHCFKRGASNIFMAAGTNNKIIYGDEGGNRPGASLIAPPTPVVDYNDIFFHDDVNGYIVGDNNRILKSQGAGLSGDDYITGSWSTMPISDGLLNQTTGNGTFNVNAIAMTNSSNGTLGGWYNDNPGGPIVQKSYARKLRDEAGLYSAYFYYDRLGKLVASQNTRQYNESPKKFSYTIYDALGRVNEVGEKAENTSANQFGSIFGTFVNFYYNPNVIDDTKFLTWINDATGSRTQVTKTYYDEQQTAIATTLPSGFTQDNLHKQIATYAYYENYSASTLPVSYDHATHLSYDIHGNVKTALQDNRKLATNSTFAGFTQASEQFNRVDYSYDLISGNVHDIDYEKNKHDQWHHHYSYDADNRIKSVETSTDDVVWDRDAKNFYYTHGPLARVEIGNDKIQGVDLAYTLQGQVKGVNSNTLLAKNDMGQDGVVASPANNSLFAWDVYGYSLNYFNDEYSAINPAKWTNVGDRFEAYKPATSNLLASRNDLYNGNITAMVTSIRDPNTGAVLPLGMAYKYDQLNRIKKAIGFEDVDVNPGTISSPNPNYNTWGSASLPATYKKYQNTFSYDPNGNIISQERYDKNDNQMDGFSYKYNVQGGQLVQNRLYHVNDPVSSAAYTQDIDDQGAFTASPNLINTNNNYAYDEQGRLIKDVQEEIAKIVWRVDGKVGEVIRATGSTRKNFKFDYDAAGSRVAKHQFSSAGVWEKSTYYVLDLAGRIMAIYTKKVDPSTSSSSYKVIERNVYAGGRIGMNTKEVELIAAPPLSAIVYGHELGLKKYEYNNHLGNVVAVTTDRKVPVDDGDYDNNNDGVNDLSVPISTSPDGIVDFYTADLQNVYDYYPFGMLIKERSLEKQVCTTIVTTTVNTVFNDQFTSGTGGYIILSASTALSNSAGMLKVDKASGSGAIGCYKDFVATSGTTYTLNFNFDKGNLAPGHSVIAEVIDLTTTTVVFTSPALTVTGAYGTYNFTATTSGSYRLRFTRLGPPSNKYFFLDNIKITYTTTASNTTCVTASQYRYGFNGVEKDDEIKGDGNSDNMDFRFLDPRLGRWLSPDPVIKPYESPYVGFANNPIYYSDPTGLDNDPLPNKVFKIGPFQIHIAKRNKIIRKITGKKFPWYIKISRIPNGKKGSKVPPTVPPTGGGTPPPTGGDTPPPPTGGDTPPPTGGGTPPPTGGGTPPPTGGGTPPPTTGGGDTPPPTGGDVPPPTTTDDPCWDEVQTGVETTGFRAIWTPVTVQSGNGLTFLPFTNTWANPAAAQAEIIRVAAAMRANGITSVNLTVPIMNTTQAQAGNPTNAGPFGTNQQLVNARAQAITALLAAQGITVASTTIAWNAPNLTTTFTGTTQVFNGWTVWQRNVTRVVHHCPSGDTFDPVQNGPTRRIVLPPNAPRPQMGTVWNPSK